MRVGFIIFLAREDGALVVNGGEGVMAGISVDFSGLLQIFVFAIRVTSTGAQIVSACVLLMQVFFYVSFFFCPRSHFPSFPPPPPLPPAPSIPFSLFFFDCVFILLISPVGYSFGVEINAVR